MMGGSLGRLSATAQSSFGRMAQHANAVTRRNEVLGMSFNELQNKIQQVETTIRTSNITSQISAARRELAALQRQSAGHAGRPLGASAPSSGGLGIGGVAVGTMLGNVGMMAVGAIGSGISAAITKSMEKEQAITGLTTFLGKNGANDAYKNIRKDADVTPFDTASLLEVNRALISSGLNAKDARVDAMNLANAVSAVGGGNDELSRMAANMQQIKTTGKATSVDIKQFGLAGINIYAMLAKSTGKSIEQVKEMDISYQELSKSFAMSAGKGGMYEGALKAQSLTKGGKWSTVKDKLGNAASDIGDAFSPLINKLLDQGIGFLEGLPGMLAQAQPFIDNISAGVEVVVNALAWGGSQIIGFIKWLNNGTAGAHAFAIAMGALAGAFLTYQVIVSGAALATSILTAGQWLLNAAMEDNPVGLIVIAVGALIAGITTAYLKFEKFRAIVDGVWTLLKDVAKLVWATLTLDVKALPGLVMKIASGDSFNTGYKQSLLQSKAEKDKKIKEEAEQTANDKKAEMFGSLQTANTLAASNNSSGKAVGDTVSGGGPKVVNINLGKFFDTIQFTTLNSGETAQELEKVVTECLARVLFNGSKLV